MDDHQMIKKKYMNKWSIAFICSMLVFILMVAFMIVEIQRGREKNEFTLSVVYSAFQSEVVHLINDDIVLLKGYLTFVEVNNLTQENSTAYLDRLTGANKNFYRNITLIEDTTIKWIYPQVGNEDAIGVDLSKANGQKEAVELVKDKRQSMMDGPIDLVQGGKGYIVRLPIVKSNGSYWGQLSIVLNADEINEEIKLIAKHKGIKVNIETYEGNLVIDNEEVLVNNPLYFQLNDKYFDWKVSAIPFNGWEQDWFNLILIVIVGVISSVGVFLAVYYVIKANENLEVLASKDFLTGLYNRHFLEDYQALVLSRADRYQKTVGFILLDLDHFKYINDTYGHKVGDKVLQKTAENLKKQTRVNEAAFRLGGDEFLVVLPDIQSSSELDKVENRLKEGFAKKVGIFGHDIQIVASIGTGLYPRDGTSFDQVLHEVDIRMYKNKAIKNKE